MKKTYKIDVDCANCANLMEDAARKTAGGPGPQGRHAGGPQSLQESGARL